jgi:hypothetical protein
MKDSFDWRIWSMHLSRLENPGRMMSAQPLSSLKDGMELPECNRDGLAAMCVGKQTPKLV